MTIRTAVTLADFQGRWTVRRTIVQDDGTTGRADGEVRMTPDAAGLRYRETGRLAVGGAAPMAYERTYLWRAAGDAIAVLFEDGRPFHRFAADRLHDRHLCPPDTYEVSYQLDLPRSWVCVWRVDGPRKAYRMEVACRR